MTIRVIDSGSRRPVLLGCGLVEPASGTFRSMDDRAATFAATLGITDEAVLHAFSATPRHLFLPGMDLDQVYRDDALPTRWDGNRPTSSSTQPSLMAQMIEALALDPGDRVLEIGVGTGYNAAVITRVTGAPVVSVDVQSDVVTDARAALTRAGVSNVRVEHGDGYDGFPGAGPYERIVVTCGVRGIPPGWLDQLTDGGFVLAPLAHGGLHPIVRIERDLRATVQSGRASFMHAAGALYPILSDDFPPPIGSCPEAAVSAAASLGAAYNDFWFAAATLDRRITQAEAAPGWLPALVDEDSVAWWDRQAAHAAGQRSAELLRHALDLVDRWEALGRPAARAWSTTLSQAPVTPPLLVAHSWRVEGGVEGGDPY